MRSRNRKAIFWLVLICATLVLPGWAGAVNSPKNVIARVLKSDGATPPANATITITATDGVGDTATYTGGADPRGIIAYNETNGAITLVMANFTAQWVAGQTLTIEVLSGTPGVAGFEFGDTSTTLTADALQAFTTDANLDFQLSASQRNMTVTAGNNQTGTVGTALATAVEVTVIDDFGSPVQGVTPAAAGNGTLTMSATGADGKSTGTWTLGTTVGAQTMTITLAGYPNAVASATAGAGAATAAQSVISAALAPATITAAGTATATVQFNDQYGNAATSLGGAALAATGATLTGATWAVVNNGDGTATATYTPGLAGSETGLKITLGGVQIGADQSVTVNPGVASATQSQIVAALNPSTITADGTATATIQFRDAGGNATTDLGGAALAATGATLAGATWAVVDNGNGTATATYTPGLAGNETALKITLGVTQIGADQSVTVTPGAADATQSLIAAALAPATITADATATATVQFKDQNGNNTTSLGGAALAATGATLAGATWAVVDNGDGTATATYTPGLIGSEAALQITLGGTQIGADQSVTVTPGAATAAQSVFAAALAPATITADATATATVQFKDQRGNNTTNIGGAALAATGATLTGATWAVVDNGDGTATATYTPSAVGSETALQITLGGTQIGANQSVTVTPGAAVKMTLAASKTTLASDGKGTATLTARILDQKDNLVTTDDTTVVTFTLTDGTYATITGSPATATDGVATATVTTNAGTVPVPPATTDVNITSVPVLTPPAALTLTIVNFSIQVNTPAAPFVDGTGVHLVTSASTPTTATFEGVGSTTGDYRWALTGVGTISSTTADTITYTAPATVTGASQTGTLTLTSATDGALTDNITITVYNPVAVTWPTAAVGIATGDNTKVVTASGGTGTYKFESSDVTKATVNADTGAITPVAAGTITVKVRDATYGDFAVVNGFLAVTPNIQIVAPIVVSGPAAVDTAGTATYTFTGGTGAVNWTADSGSITAAGVFTAPAVASGSVTVKITATDQVYGDIKGEYTVTVFGSVAIMEMPAGYVDGQPLTYPLLTAGLTLTLSAGDATRNYDWVVKDWTDAQIVSQLTGASTFVLDPDVLFAASGAGVYTVTLTDQDNPTLAPATLKVRVPMRFVATKFSAAAVKDAGTYRTDADTSDTYTVSGGPAGNVYNFEAYDLSGVAVTAGVGAFQDASPTNNDNVFAFAAGITSLASYRVMVGLDDTSADPDVVRLIDAGLDEVWSGIFRIVPVVTFAGVVLEVDEVTPIAGATVTATFDPTVTDTTIADGSFSIPGIELTGATYSFVVAKTGYIDKIVSGTEIPDDAEIILEALGAGGTISGTVTLSDDPVPYASGTVRVKAKTALGAYVQDSEAFDIVVLANATTGAYTFPIPADFTALGPFDLEFTKSGYIFDEAAGLGVLTGVALAAANADITLSPSTVISIAATPQDTSAPADGVFDQVLVTITAEAGLAPARFDGTATEIEVRDASNNVITLDAFASAGANTWSFVHTPYENFTITVQADVSEDRDVGAGYKATTTYSYVKSAAQNETAVDPILGGTATSTSGDSTVTVPPGGLTGDLPATVTVVIVEADAGEAGATAITGSEILEVYLVDENGDRVTSGNIARIEITLKFDPTVVTSGTLESGTYVIFQAATVNDLIAGNATPVPASQIIPPVDYTNGIVRFWVDHLSAFGVGAAPAVQQQGGGGGGGGCFIDTLSGPSAQGWFAPLILMALAAGAWFVRRAAR